MTFTLRQFMRSRLLRALGMLAWVLLVVNSLAAAPMGMAGVPRSHPVHITVAVVSEHCHHHVASNGSRPCCDAQHGCCGGATGHACHCAAMCNSTLPPATVVVLAAVAMTARYAMPLSVMAPSLNTAPPLRPPAV
jgi:hypothetical protein